MVARASHVGLLTLALIAVFGEQTLRAGTLHVPADYATIQAAIDAAADGDEIIVAAGTYKEAIDFKGKAVHLHSAEGAEQTVIDATSRSASVVTCATGEGADSILEGFTITGGSGTPDQSGNRYGGGMYNLATSPTVTNCTFSGNSANRGAGGGMFNKDSVPTVTNCMFSGNLTYDGGGMCNDGGSPTVANCTFTGNSGAGSGGGMGNYYSNPMVTNCSFSGNSAGYGGGGVFNYASSPTATDCTFSGNSAVSGGGGMYNILGNPTANDCTFNENSAEYSGGGIYNEASSLTVTNCTLNGNWADQGGGGGMFNDYSSATVRNSRFSGNSSYDGGGMADQHRSSATVTNCTFSGNSADNGGAISSADGSATTVSNCVLWSDAAAAGAELWVGTTRSLPASISITYSDVAGGQDGVHVGEGSTLNWGAGNIDGDPLFADPANGDFHLTQDSLCIDAGSNALLAAAADVDDDCRVMDGDGDGLSFADMGIDEVSGSFLDCNGNGVCDTQEPDDDCNENFIPDECDLANNWSKDCNGNAIPDECDIAHGTSPDCNGNGVPDDCDLANGTSLDLIPSGGDGIPDECEPVQNVTQNTYYGRVQAALDAARDGDEIVVSAGTYNEAINFNGNAVYLHSAGGPEQTIIDATGLEGSVVTFATRETSDAVLDGFTVTGGLGTGVCSYEVEGGGHGGSMYVTIFGGGGILIVDASPTITRCIIAGNSSGWGGGLFVGGGHVTVTDTLFTRNSGGALSSSDGTFSLTRCTIEYNDVGVLCPYEISTGCSQYGGAGEIVDCVIRHNRGPGVVGGSYADHRITIQACTITENESGIVCDGCEVSDCIIALNSPHGGVTIRSFYPDRKNSIRDSLILGNNSEHNGGGIRCSGGELTIAGCTVVGNAAAQAGGGLATREDVGDPPNARIINSIFVGNSAPAGAQLAVLDLYESYGSALSVAYSDVEGGQAAVQVDSHSLLTWGDANIDADPLFVRNSSDGGDGWGDDPNTPEFDESSNDDFGDLRLTSDSPCIDAGNNAEPLSGSDADGQCRVMDGDGDGAPVLDIGLYEFAGAVPDCNRDGVCDGQQADQGDVPDCNRNLVPDECDIADGASQDVVPAGGDEIPDECQRVLIVAQSTRYRWIQEALDAAADGDELIASPGTYNEKIDFRGKMVRLHSAAGPATTILDATGLNGPAVTCSSGETSSTILEGFTIAGGDAHSGGGMYNYESSPTVINCTFSGNSASWGGGGIYNWAGQPTITNCTFIGNFANWGGGGGMYSWSGSPTVTNCTFSGNVSGSDGGAMQIDGGSVATASNLTLWGNSAPNGKQISLGVQKESALTIAYSDVQGGKAGVYVKNNSKLTWGAGNLNTDPRFVRNPSDGGDGWGDNPNSPKFDESSNDDFGDLRLQSNSPCIDAGDPAFDPPPGATDLDDFRRIWDGNADGTTIVDMGAYEFGAHAYGDVNCDGGIDFNDIDAFVTALAGRDDYEQSFPDCAYLLADVNADGSVDFGDIDAFVIGLINGGCP